MVANKENRKKEVEAAKAIMSIAEAMEASTSYVTNYLELQDWVRENAPDMKFILDEEVVIEFEDMLYHVIKAIKSSREIKEMIKKNMDSSVVAVNAIADALDRLATMEE